ncbi:MAG TPA: serine/threonine protein kinase [Nannocystis exedens]|nr:serine/threonine protein kinase [Nannocystis exedens]
MQSSARQVRPVKEQAIAREWGNLLVVVGERQLEWTPTIGRSGLVSSEADPEIDCKPEPTLSSAQRIGRFAILRPLGEGGMGKIYVGYDEELNRKVAIKLLRSSAQGEQAKSRLLREAQALACLSHPNVVQVHEVGTEDGQVFVAMELVDGQTLAEWADESADWRVRLALLIQAGRGLAAAHAAGLVHRDFKPHNVLVGRDGRVRVLDFGLVRSASADPVNKAGRSTQSIDEDRTECTLSQSGAGPSTTDERPQSPLCAPLTLRGSIVGTPAYMAPEQHAGKPCDTAADQFAFCVCAFEFLFGVRPFKGRALMTLALAKDAGEIEAIPSSNPVPRSIREAIIRGLAAAPEHRWPDLDTLLAQLERGLARRGPWLLAGLIGIGVLGLGAGLLLSPEPLAAPAPVDPCAQASARADAQIGAAWTAQRRDRLSSIVSTPTSITTLDEWAQSFRAASESACADVHSRRIRSEVSLDRRGVCLDRRLSEFEGLAAAVDAGKVVSEHQLVERLGQLGDPGSCLGEAVLAGEFESPPAEDRAAIAELRRHLVAVNTGLGDSLSERITAAEGLLARARELGWRPLIAEVSLGLGHLHVLTSDAPKAREFLGETLDIAGRGNDVELTAKAWSELNRIERTLSFDPVAAEWTWQRQSAVFADISPDLRQRARLRSDRGLVDALQAQRGAAEKALREALVLYEEVGPIAAWEQAATLRRLGALIMDIGRADEALQLFARARTLETGMDSPGPGQQRTLLDASTMLDEVLALFFAGRHDEALVRLDEALQRAIAELGPRSELVARIHVTYVAIYAALEQNDRLREHAELADAISLAALGPTHAFRTDVLSAVGTAAQVEGRLSDAHNAYEQSLAVVRRVKPEGSIEVAEAELNLAVVLDRLGEPKRAQRLIDHCLPILQRELEAGHPEIAMARSVYR